MTRAAERPILFAAPMVRALLDGRKTQTRRVVKPMPDWLYPEPCCSTTSEGWQGPIDRATWAESADPDMDFRRCPYGQPGDRLWVRETLKRQAFGAEWRYAADLTPLEPYNGQRERHAWSHEKAGNTCVSIHMPRWASRITLEITDVRVERLNEISEADAMAEGLEWVVPGMWSVDRTLPIIGEDPREVYRELWNHINGPGAWAGNPWVWVVTFKVAAP